MYEDEHGVVHDEVEIEDFEYDPESDSFMYPCPCGDEFTVLREDLMNGGRYARCPSCSLMVLVIFNPDSLDSIINIKSGHKISSTKGSKSVKVTR